MGDEDNRLVFSHKPYYLLYFIAFDLSSIMIYLYPLISFGLHSVYNWSTNYTVDLKSVSSLSAALLSADCNA
ncbi:hypothetical protein SAMN05421578_106273 [Paenibacillus macquariensis]|uniref:Uncharacterized protein n=1 Tax=Paenibacillus macquariensis TaxID=948756 RepID=A0ABY1K0B6_9BACL|nr:hypothetical protein SAMN05421578_106273 [Paenibacillus macquariensis]